MVADAGREQLVESIFTAQRAAGRALLARARVGVSSGGLTFPRVLLLRVIVAGGRSSSKQLAAALRVTTANLPGLLDKLEGEGLIARVRDRRDRRIVYVEATPEGRRKLKSLWRAGMRQVATDLADWSDADLRTLRDLLTRLARSGTEPHQESRLLTIQLVPASRRRTA